MQTVTTPDNAVLQQPKASASTVEDTYLNHQPAPQHELSQENRLLQGHQSQPSKVLVHLSETGVNAGRRLCMAPYDHASRSVHAMYAPLHNPAFRENVCGECLSVWALEAYDDGDQLPDYITAARAVAKQTGVKAKHDDAVDVAP